MTVSMWMTRDLITIRPDTPIAEAAAIMVRNGIRHLLVLESRTEPHLAGIVSASDILHAFPADVNPFAAMPPDTQQIPRSAGEIMARQPHTTEPDTPIEEAVVVMHDAQVSALPVMRNKRLVGIIAESDIFRAFVSLFSARGGGARISFDVTKGEDVFALIAQLAKRDDVQVTSLMWTQHESQPVCVARVVGKGVEKLLDDLWSSGHRVVNVIRFPGG